MFVILFFILLLFSEVLEIMILKTSLAEPQGMLSICIIFSGNVSFSMLINFMLIKRNECNASRRFSKIKPQSFRQKVFEGAVFSAQKIKDSRSLKGWGWISRKGDRFCRYFQKRWWYFRWKINFRKSTSFELLWIFTF